SYECGNKAIQNKLLKANSAEAFSYVVFSSSDVYSNTSAFGYTQNKDQTTVAAKANLRLGKNKTARSYLRVGANASGSQSIFEFYSQDSWNNNVGFNLAYMFKINGANA